MFANNYIYNNYNHKETDIHDEKNSVSKALLQELEEKVQYLRDIFNKDLGSNE